MQFLKKHYDKIVLVVVLLTVAAVSLLLTVRAGDERQKLADQLQQKVAGNQKAFKSVDLAASSLALEHLSSPMMVMLAGEHKTFNPNTWIRTTSGTIIPVKETGNKGPRGLTLIATRPLALSITFSAVAGTGDPYRYQFNVLRDHEKQASKRRPLTVSLSEGSKNELFVLREVHGPKDNPTEVVIELLEGGGRATLIRDKPFTKGLAFAADLLYEAENKPINGKRAEETILLSSVAYKIVAIDKDALIIQASNKVRTTIKLAAAP